VAETFITRQQGIGRDRQIVTHIDPLRASEFVSTVLSGAANYVSGFSILDIDAGNVARIRPVNIFMQNRETALAAVAFRDGSITGDIVAGPFTVNPAQDRTIGPDELQGRYFLSGIYPVVVSGAYAAGIVTQIGYIIEADDYFE
jgi:hypothetical protein